MKKVLFIVGSLRKRSLNRQLAEASCRYLDGAEAEFLDCGIFPFMDQDLEYPVPEPVRAAREAVAASDGIWLVTPEYNHSYSGVMKNAIDWLSRPVDPLDRKTPSVLKGKKVTISGAAGSDAAIDARINTVQLALKVGMEVIGGEGFGIALGKDAFVTDELVLTAEEEEALARQAREFLNHI